MLTRKTSPTSFSRAVVLATAAALVLAVPPPVAQARPAAPAVVKDVSAATTNVSEATDFSARRRVARRGYRNNNAAGLAFMGLALGTVGAVIANQQRRDYYRQNHYYGGNPYYGGGYYAQPQPYYGGGYYGY
ncbi:MAG: hypothetical protein V4661_08835 [Pseudomonadota bacterium]